MTAARTPEVVSLKVTLNGIRPPVWRRLRLSTDTTLAALNEYLLTAMGWAGHHLHLFDVGGEEYGDPATTDDVADEKRVTIAKLLRSGVNRFAWLYDFGDDWEHTVLLEKRRPHDGDVPACIAGARNCPPENSGGVWGYLELLEILADPKHPEREETIEFLCEDFDPEDFSVLDTDARFARKFRNGVKPRAVPR